MPTVCRYVNSKTEVITSPGHMGAWMQRPGKKQLSMLSFLQGSSGLLEDRALQATDLSAFGSGLRAPSALPAVGRILRL